MHWSSPSTAVDRAHQREVLRVTHPFHPLRDRTYTLESCRQAWGEPRVYFYDEEGELRHLPARWTDVEETDPVGCNNSAEPQPVTGADVATS